MAGSKTVWLVGMMGAGKSTVGRILARRLGRPFVDCDAEIERDAGRRIADIFEDAGEAAFRKLEREKIRSLAGEEAVVALGGGAIAQRGAAKRLRDSGTVIYLRARPETLLARLGRCRDRPLLRDLPEAKRRERLTALLAQRAPAYATAEIALDTDGLPVEEVADALAERLGGAGPARRTVRVLLDDRSYAIHLGSGTLGEVGPEVARHASTGRAAVVSVPPVGRRYAPRVLRALRAAGLRVLRIEVPDGDRSKSFRQLTRIYDALLDWGADRGTAIVALGGGVVGDLAGFAAASYLRGVPFVQVPTTILAMVDSSIGGKVGVNLPQGKNLVGAFYQPRSVWIDVDTLRTLSPRLRAAGLAEVVKAGAIWDAELFEQIEECAEALMELDGERLLPVLERACAIKAEVVGRDERETGLRRLLNFGHTLGHAVETLSGYRGVLHGEAVSMGMVAAARRSEQHGHSPAGTADRLSALLARLGLPTELPDFPRKAYLDALRVDKKRQDAVIQYVVLKGIGRADVEPLTPAQIVSGSRARKRRR